MLEDPYSLSRYALSSDSTGKDGPGASELSGVSGALELLKRWKSPISLFRRFASSGARFSRAGLFLDLLRELSSSLSSSSSKTRFSFIFWEDDCPICCLDFFPADEALNISVREDKSAFHVRFLP